MATTLVASAWTGPRPRPPPAPLYVSAGLARPRRRLPWLRGGGVRPVFGRISGPPRATSEPGA
eukprot:5640862-Lingulodinium_polyedra.AAC.1